MNRWLGLLVFSFILLVVNGCSQESQEQNRGQAQPTMGEKVETVTETEGNQMDIQLFFADDQALDLLESKGKLIFDKDEDKYKKAYLALTKSSDEKMVSLWEENDLAQVSFDEGTLTFDFKMTDHQLGSSGERLQILSLLKTMFQFPEVKKIQLNNRGQESLNGHVDITEPFTRDMLAGL